MLNMDAKRLARCQSCAGAIAEASAASESPVQFVQVLNPPPDSRMSVGLR